MLYCLDTNIVIEFFRKNPLYQEKMKELEEKQIEISLNPIILCELWRGIHLAQEKERALELLENFLKTVKILPFTEQAAKVYGKYYAELKKLGKQTQEFDLIIASICMSHNAILVTGNHKDFANIKELKFIVW